MFHVRPPETGYAAIIALAIADVGQLVTLAGGSAEKAERAAKGSLRAEREALERVREQHGMMASQFGRVTARIVPTGGGQTAGAPPWLLPALGLGAVAVFVARRRRR